MTKTKSSAFERSSSVWRLSLTADEKDVLDRFLDDQGQSLKQVIDLSIAHAIMAWHRNRLPEFILPSKDSFKVGVRIDKIAVETLNARAQDWFNGLPNPPISNLSLLLTALWAYILETAKDDFASQVARLLEQQNRVKIKLAADRFAS
ncbi:MAG: hypothetical protein AAGK23_12570 [Pseudomonadota bacterium]